MAAVAVSRPGIRFMSRNDPEALDPRIKEAIEADNARRDALRRPDPPSDYNEPAAAPPDEPGLLATLGLDEAMPLAHRKADWVKAFGRSEWCSRKSNDGDCKTQESVVELVVLAKDLGLSANTEVIYKKETYRLAQLLLRKLVEDPHCANKEEARDVLLGELKERGLPVGEKPTAKSVPVQYYDGHSHRYWYEAEDRCWHTESEENAVRRLIEAGKSNLHEADGSLSEIEKHLLQIRNRNCVDVAMALAGYPRGVHEIAGKMVLVTDSFNLPETKPDPECEHFEHHVGLLQGLLRDQFDLFIAKLQCDRAALRAGHRTGGQALMLAGMPGIGKTFLLESIIRPALGGRAANVFASLSGASAFNKESACSEVHYVDDGNPFTDREARRCFGNAVKQSVANASMWVHGKGVDGITLPLYRRLFVICNLDALEAMPEIEPDLEAKVIILKGYPFAMPDGLLPLPVLTDIKAVEGFNATLERERPYFLWFVDNFIIPPALKSKKRFGLVAYKNPEIRTALRALGPEQEAHYIVQRALQLDLVSGLSTEQEYEINALYSMLLENPHTKERAKMAFKSVRALGNALARLRRDAVLKKFYFRRESNGQSFWRIKRDSSGCEATESVLTHSETTGNNSLIIKRFKQPQ